MAADVILEPAPSWRNIFQRQPSRGERQWIGVHFDVSAIIVDRLLQTFVEIQLLKRPRRIVENRG